MIMKHRPHNSVSGFTIVELLIVIVVIGILAAITIVAYNGIQGRARDSQRVSDLKSIQKAIELHRIQTGAVPVSSASGLGAQSGWESSAREAKGEFLKPLVSNGVVSAVPVDPVNNATEDSMTAAAASNKYTYVYYVYPAGNSGCDPARGRYYVLGALSMTTTGNGPHASSPGFNCSGRDWQADFSWVTGGYEN